jgi:hypothetical protein
MPITVATLRLGGDTVAPRPATVRCAQCGCVAPEEQARPNRFWAYWSDGFGGVYPFCPECARPELLPAAPASERAPRVRHRAASSSDS